MKICAHYGAVKGQIQTPDYRLLNVLLQQLPRDGRWTNDRRDRWLQAIAASVDLVVEVEEDK